MADFLASNQHQIAVVGIAVGVALLIWFLECRTNPPGRTCGVVKEPDYPVSVPPLVLVEPLSPPNFCPPLPPADLPPFPICYPPIQPTEQDFHDVPVGNYVFKPHVFQYQKTEWGLDGWYAECPSDPNCSVKTDDLTFDHRFRIPVDNSCGGIY